ncbi:MAG: DUF4440 domain-containing protein [Pseudomonadota bacterium]
MPTKTRIDTPPSEEAAIRAVLERDITSYLARDRDAWLDCWARDARFQSIMECGTMQIARSFETFARNVFAAMDAEPDPVQADVRFDNLSIDVSGNTAWATYEEIVSSPSNPHATPTHSHNFRLLEKVSGHWRILFHGCWAEAERNADVPIIEVAKDGRVLWMSGAAQASLTDFAGLTVSNGILRPANPALNARFKDVIARAHGLTGFGAYNRAKSDSGGDVRFPVVLGEDEETAPLLCWVKVADGRVYVLFGTRKDLWRQIDVLKAIYGLSDAQTALVRLLTYGQAIDGAADTLGITRNTARTHLRRVYEKTGVSSQVALLRLVVSFSA